MKLRLSAFCFVVLLSTGSPGIMQGANAQDSASAAAGNRATPIAQIRDWFTKYDQVRRQSQMSPPERAKADSMLSKGLSIVMPGPDKVESAALFQTLEQRDAAAADQLKKMPLYPETEQLHRGYNTYFENAAQLFGDYLRVQNNLMSTDPVTGKPLMGQLIARKKNLEDLDMNNKQIDAELRSRFKIPAYKY